LVRELAIHGWGAKKRGMMKFLRSQETSYRNPTIVSLDSQPYRSEREKLPRDLVI